MLKSELEKMLDSYELNLLTIADTFYKENQFMDELFYYPIETAGPDWGRIRNRTDSFLDEETIMMISLLVAFLSVEGEVKDFLNTRKINLSTLKDNTNFCFIDADTDDSTDKADFEIDDELYSYFIEKISNTNYYSAVAELIKKIISSDVSEFIYLFYDNYQSVHKLERDLEREVRREGKAAKGRKEKKVVGRTIEKIPVSSPNDYLSEKGSTFSVDNISNISCNRNPAAGRSKEIKALGIVLCTPKKSPILLGESGGGKTTIVKGLAYSIQKHEIPALDGYTILSTSAANIVSGCSFRGMMEDRVKSIINYCLGKKIILFIDEIHTLIGAGQGINSNIDVFEIFKPYLSDGTIKIIGATTISEFNELISKREGFKRRFEPVFVKEPNEKALTDIIDYTLRTYSEDYGVSLNITEDEIHLIKKVISELTSNIENRKINIFSPNKVFMGLNKKCNPDLVVSILARAFGIAIYNGTALTKDDIIESLQLEDALIYDAVTLAIRKMNKISPPINKGAKIISFPGPKY